MKFKVSFDKLINESSFRYYINDKLTDYYTLIQEYGDEAFDYFEIDNQVIRFYV